MNEPKQEHIPLYKAHKPSKAGDLVTALFDDMESKQLDNLNDAGKALIERIATFLGVLFGLSILSNNFPPSYLKGNTPVKVLLIAALSAYLLALGAALWATQVRFYSLHTNDATRLQTDLEQMIRHKIGWLRLANVLFALGTILLAMLLIVIVWNV